MRWWKFVLLPRVEKIKLLLSLALKVPWCPWKHASKNAHNCLWSGSLWSSVQLPMASQSGGRRDLFRKIIFARHRPVPPSCVSILRSAQTPCKHSSHWLEHLIWAGATPRTTAVASAHPVRIQCTNTFQEQTQSNIKRCTLLSS